MLDIIDIICNQLSERNATLFLGAGINFGIKNNSGESFPLGQELSNWICKDLLNEPNLQTTLDESSEMARYKIGSKELNNYLYDKFSEFNPGTAHLSLVQLPWDVIYTTNYDLLVEKASIATSVNSAGVINPVFSTDTDLTRFSEEDILYYKLHGSIEVANTEEGRLILTKEDYRYYESHRKLLFNRLRRDLLNRTFVFIGYSLRDDNFRAILEDCRSILNVSNFPLSFAVRNNFTDLEESFWREKYNIQLVKADGGEFLNSLKDTWNSQNRSVIPFTQRRSNNYLQVDSSTRFRKIAESFYLVRADDCTAPSAPKLFFNGGEPSWGDIRDKIAPPRQLYWTILETIFPELSTPDSSASLYLVTGAAGTGKTTLVRTIAYDLSKDFNLDVLIHIPNTPLDSRFISQLVDSKNSQRIIVIIHNSSEQIRALEQFVGDIKQRKLPVTIILEERRNQWNSSIASTRSRLSPVEFELNSLSAEEISSILDSLNKYDSLGKLTGYPREYQVSHFTELAHKELLVALRELTSGASFDEIIRDEFNKIPSKLAKQAYVYVSALGQLDLHVRYETLISLLELRYDQLGTEVFLPTEGILISGEESGNSRHNAGFRLRTRHPVIASIIFDMAAPDDNSKFDILNSLLTQLDPGYPEDSRLLNEITRNRKLVNTFSSPDKRRAIYERLSVILPNNPYVLQHRSILERDLSQADQSVSYARQAIKLGGDNPVLLNTLGMALERAARSTNEPLRKRAFLSEATKIFEEGMRQDSSNPYSYIGMTLIYKQNIDNEADFQRKQVLKAEVFSFLKEAHESTGESEVIAGELSKWENQIGTKEEAIQILRMALSKEPTNTRLRDLWIIFEIQKKQFSEALKLAMDGERLDPTSWRIQRHIARLSRDLGKPIESVKGHYEAAIRHKKGDISLLIELGAYLFMKNKFADSDKIFAEAKKLQVTGYEKQKIREWWKSSGDEKAVFKGKIVGISGHLAFVMALPENFEASFWRNRYQLSDLRERDSIKFSVGFNAYGPSAQDIAVVNSI